MSVETDVDRLAMLRDAGELGEVDGESVWLVYDAEFVAVLDGLVGSSTPSVLGRTSDLAAADRGSLVTVEAGSFAVAHAPEPDGVGLTRLVLRALE